MGRPTIYTQELAEKFCKKIAEGNSVRSVCSSDEMPAFQTIFRWLRENKDFREQYEYAIEERTYAMGEDILDIADDGTNDYMTITRGDMTYNVENKEVTNRSKLRVETRKWIMSKMKPKKYGDKLDLSTMGKELPQPLLYGLHNNDGNKESSESDKKD